MGLFGKGKLCCNCGGKTNTETRQKLSDGTFLCRDCVRKCSPMMQESTFSKLSSANVHAHIQETENNVLSFKDVFREDEAVLIGSRKVISCDTSKGLWMIPGTNGADQFRFDQVKGYRLRFRTQFLSEDMVRRARSRNDRLRDSLLDIVAHATAESNYLFPSCPTDKLVTGIMFEIKLDHPWIDSVTLNVWDDELESYDERVKAGYRCAAEVILLMERYKA